MSGLSSLLLCVLTLPLQQAPAPPEPAQAAQHAAAATADHEGDASEAPTPGEIFTGLFKHIEQHPVTALWFGGGKGLRFVKPYATDAAGEPASVDHHGHPVAFADRAELDGYYASQFGGGRGLLIYNINTAQWIAAGLALALVLVAARQARAPGGQASRGVLFLLVQWVVLFVRDQMVYPVMGKEIGRRFLPFFLTQAVFILFMNLLGLLYIGSLGGTATANLMVTAGMALTTLLCIHASGIREHGFAKHWKNFIPHGLPVFVLPIIIPVEIIGMLVKPAALTIRLFANMTAGHLVVLGLFGLIYMANMYVPLLFPMSVGIYALELFVCFVQAYIFTYLSVIFVGASVHPEH